MPRIFNYSQTPSIRILRGKVEGLLHLGRRKTVCNNEVSVLSGCPQSGVRLYREKIHMKRLTCVYIYLIQLLQNCCV